MSKMISLLLSAMLVFCLTGINGLRFPSTGMAIPNMGPSSNSNTHLVASTVPQKVYEASDNVTEAIRTRFNRAKYNIREEMEDWIFWSLRVTPIAIIIFNLPLQLHDGAKMTILTALVASTMLLEGANRVSNAIYATTWKSVITPNQGKH